MSLGMVMPIKCSNHDSCSSLERQYLKGVQHMYESGIDRVPSKYIWPEAERPNACNGRSSSRRPDDLIDLKLPVIDCAELKGSNRSRMLESLACACENYGFFQLSNHGISNEIISNMVNVSKRFFELPLTQKEKYLSADMSLPVRYGTSFNQTRDQVFCWRDFLKLICDPQPDILSLWPSSPTDLKEMAVAYAKEVKLVFLLLVEAILESLGIKDTTAINGNTELAEGDENDDEMFKELENGSQILVMNCYPPCPEPDLTVGMPPHSDYGFLTLLLQDEVRGLQIHHGDNWVTVEPVPGSFVVNVGDHLEIYSNGRYKSVLHRVLVNDVKYRISVASLHSLSFTATVRPSSKLVNQMNPKRYKDTDFSSFLEFVKSRDLTNKNFIESQKL